MTTNKKKGATNRRPSLTKKKKALLQALKNTLGNVSKAVEATGLSRQTFYHYYNSDEKFKEAVDDVTEYNLDFTESMLMKNIREGKETSIIFMLKTKGKARGYIEKTEVEHGGSDAFLEAMKEASRLRREAENGQG